MDGAKLFFSLLATLPINATLVYLIIKDIKEWADELDSKQNSLDNLLTETIVIALSNNEKKMLDRLKKIDGATTDSQCIRLKIKEEIEQYSEEF